METPTIISITDETSGKYYRTELVVHLSDGRKVDVELSSGDPEPSYIEKEAAAVSECAEDYFCDGHYERDATRIVADQIIRKLVA